MIEKIKSIKDFVKSKLQQNQSNRDSDNKLIANIWYYQIGGSNIAKMSAMDFLKILSEDKLSSPETIRRVRQKIQEQDPSLRGSSYKIRKIKSEEVRSEIKNV